MNTMALFDEDLDTRFSQQDTPTPAIDRVLPYNGIVQEGDMRWLVVFNGRKVAIYRKYATAALVLGDLLTGAPLQNHAVLIGCCRLKPAIEPRENRRHDR